MQDVEQIRANFLFNVFERFLKILCGIFLRLCVAVAASDHALCDDADTEALANVLLVLATRVCHCVQHIDRFDLGLLCRLFHRYQLQQRLNSAHLRQEPAAYITSLQNTNYSKSRSLTVEHWRYDSPFCYTHRFTAKSVAYSFIFLMVVCVSVLAAVRIGRTDRPKMT